ncbi:DNA polymerase [Nocardioides sp. 503]|uniref:DNA polymerase n=1 Tax=Nocardioides sp. 503 TaxID=2508326 RepID=UPI00106FA52D|nr:DNA polymerase [Nocardioides sp. 503]
MTEAPRTFAEHVADYALAGWPCILPVPAATKTPPPVGFTGADGRDTGPMDLVDWVAHFPHHSIALRMPEDVIGIDVDQYLKGTVQKHGAETLGHFLQRWGPLPATWSSTAREPGGPSRIYFFRVPVRRYATKLDTGTTSDVEIIQRHHRYAVVAPSPHKGAGQPYAWYDPTGAVSDKPPKPDEFPDLPPAWVEGLTEGATLAGPAAADRSSGEALLDQLLDDWRPECADITSARLQAADELTRADAGSRHDTMTARVHHLVQLAAGGHTGVAHAVLELRDAWATLTAGEDRGEELERMLLTSARKAVTVVGQVQVPSDPCLMMADGFPLPPLAPGDPGEGDPELQIVEPPRWAGVRQVIGAHAFDPNAGLDQPLAEAVLGRTFPALRYAYDSDGWLLRAPQRWELHKRLSPWAVAQVAPLMPVGDPTAEKGTDPFERAKRRARFMTAAGAGAVAKMIDSLVAGGMHPVALALADLDSDPEVLWAGGMPWSLRASLEGPTLALVDPATPHLHTAGVTPEKRPTPLWDAFLAAVWPDPEIRAWAVRVLAIALTGYADRALPILIGETGRGKTQVIHLLMSVLGSYAHAADSRLLTPAGENAHASIVFALKGRRLSFIDEGPREGRVAQERLKQLTGGGELTANQMNQNPITFRPSHTLVLTTNDEPPLTDPAVRSRSRLIPCEGDPEAIRLARAAIGHVSSTAWRTEAPGVLATMMAEAAAWLAGPSTGLVTAAPESIRYLAENIGAEQDPISTWVAEETEPFEPGTSSSELYQAFVASCRRNGMRPDTVPSVTKWGKVLTRLGYLPVHSRNGKARQLRVRSGGFLPGMGPVTGSDEATRHAPPAPAAGRAPETPISVDSGPSDESTGPVHSSTGGAVTGCDGLVTGSETNPSQTFPQVNPNESVIGDGCDGFEQFPTYMQASAQAHKAATGKSLQPVTQSVDDVLEGMPKPPAKPMRERSAEATAKAAALREEKRLAAIAEAAGAAVTLPAVLTRDGAIRECGTAEADLLLATITGEAGDGALTVDVEHTGYPVGHELFRLRTVQLGNEHLALVLDPHAADQADVVRRHLAAARALHAHSATADLVPLVDAGLADAEDVWAKMLDTGILAKLSDPASAGNDADLKSLSKAVLRDQALSAPADEARKALFKAGKWLTDTEVTTPIERSGWAQVDHGTETMVRYDGSDVLDCAAIARSIERPALEVLERERAVQRMTARVSHRGIRLDGDHVHRLHAEHTEARARHAEHVRSYGIDNPGSNDQVGAALIGLGAPLPRTKTGKPSVAAGVLDPMKDAEGDVGDLVRAVLDYRHHNTALVLLLEPYRELVTRGDGRARPTIFTLGADTGRMSSSRPNVQQVSREGGMRACFTADPGHLLVSADFAGVELRVAAALSQDAGLAALMSDADRDLHWEVARLAFGPQATKAQRYAVKRGVFGRIYGGGVAAVAAGVGVTHPVAQSVIDAMDALTPGLTEWSRMVREGVESGRTQFPAYSGRTIHLPTRAPHAAPNYCIQGTARELLVDALLRWRETRWGEATLFPVHDELVVVVPEDEAEAATEALVACMTTELYGVPIIADPSTPTYSWSDSS